MLSRSYLTLGVQKPSSLAGSDYTGWSRGVCMVGWLGEPPEGVGGVIFRLWGGIQGCPFGHPSPYLLQFHGQEVLVQQASRRKRRRREREKKRALPVRED